MKVNVLVLLMFEKKKIKKHFFDKIFGFLLYNIFLFQKWKKNHQIQIAKLNFKFKFPGYFSILFPNR